ncbi:MAG TPA: hypothetical protein H9857_12025 [Candidatus Desulfovibrio intestinigallinarum]|nr:hypothetical protein [Candidatus Desulfovibrio intestinigallinarum]HJA77629.1 hypothetical protein [Candidatus Desulfovibrio gallistercoris]
MTGAAGNFRDKFSNTDVSTFAFILLTVASAGLWSSFWLYGFVKSINRHAGKTTIPVALPVIVITGFSWSTVMLSVDPFDYGQMLIAKILSLMAGVLGLYISCASKRPLEEMFAKSGMPRKLSWVWCVIFPAIYQYYTVYNIEEYYAQHVEDAEDTQDAQTEARD